MIGPVDIEAASARIGGYLRRTPTLDVEAGTLCECAVALKLELFQHTGSFKVRGAFNALLSSDLGEAGVVAFSGGNHGAAIAYAATRLGVPSTIFAPDWAGPVKIERMRAFGAQVIVLKDETAIIIEKFMGHAARTGALAVHPFDDSLVVCGQGTGGLEIERQLPDLDTLLVSVGGGGLIAGITAWFQGRIKIVAVETEGTASLQNAFSDTPDLEISPSGIAASALGGTRLGVLPREILDRLRPHSVIVPDQAVFDAQVRLWDGVRIVAEPGAACALAALTSGAYRPDKGENVGVLVCGGNAQPGWFLG
jgi:threonine dehydratase